MWDLFKEFVRLFRGFQDIWLIFLAFFVIYLVILNARRGRRHSTDSEVGDLIWVDEGRHVKPFFHNGFKVVGKPDAMYNKNGLITAIEYKSRRGPVFESDWVQAFTAALAARGSGFKVRQVVVKTKSEQKAFDLPKEDLALFNIVRPFVERVRSIQNGGYGEASPSKPKCRACAYRLECRDRAI
jgi:CRISPR/Cas system-associated exonuclease Cas4 (RecB family)